MGLWKESDSVAWPNTSTPEPPPEESEEDAEEEIVEVKPKTPAQEKIELSPVSEVANWDEGITDIK